MEQDNSHIDVCSSSACMIYKKVKNIADEVWMRQGQTIQRNREAFYSPQIFEVRLKLGLLFSLLTPKHFHLQ